MNRVRTVCLLTLLSSLLILFGLFVGGRSGAVVFLGIALALNSGSYWFSSAIVLRVSRATEISREQDPPLFALVEDVASSCGMPMPRVFVIDSPQPNAFATGRSPKHAALAVTTSIRQLLTERELHGVLGHEMAHVKNRDVLTSSIVAMIAGAISMIGYSLSGSLLSGDGDGDSDSGGEAALTAIIGILIIPIAATLVQLGIGRSREFQADRDGARVVRDPEALASALAKLEVEAQRVPMKVPESTAHLFIVNPLGGGRRLSRLFSTHPPLEERIRRLRAMKPNEYGF